MKKKAFQINTKMDIYIALDESGSIDANEFKKAIEFIINLINHIPIAAHRALVGFLTFANDVRKHFGTADQYSLAQTINSINNTR